MTDIHVRDLEARLLLEAHDLSSGAEHTNLVASDCACRPQFVLRAQGVGNACSNCGSLYTQQTGTCYTCRECGTSGGCG